MMAKSLVRRLLYALFLLGIISVLAYGLSQWVPGDEIEEYLSLDDSRYASSDDALQQREAYARVAAKRGLDLPHFYFSLTPGRVPDSTYNIVPAEDRKALLTWIKVSGNQNESVALHLNMKMALQDVCPPSDTNALASMVCTEIGQWLQQPDYFIIHAGIARLFRDSLVMQQIHGPSIAALKGLNHSVEQLIHTKPVLTKTEWLPAFRWHGTANRYHQWMTGLISFKPLTSLIDGRNAWTKIIVALKWTLWLNGLAFILAIMAGVLIGIWSGTHDGALAERWVNILLFALFALPSFWLATLFIAFFSSGEWLSVFPAGGLGPYHAASNVFERWGILLRHLTLPVLCLALGSLAYISRQMKQSVIHQLSQPYVLSLRSQGVSEKTILRRHVLRNALFPLITLIGTSFPALFSGSLIIEVIFSIPGMGRLLYTSLVARDWPVVFPILMMAATLTVFSYLLTDIIYKWADPRVKSMDA